MMNKVFNRDVKENVKRKLYAESMGRCMNPKCEIELFRENGDIAEKAHIHSFAETNDNTFENLILLCPNCHTDFDKNSAFDLEEVKKWKQLRQEQVSSVFSKKFSSFTELESVVRPILLENQNIFSNYYLNDSKKLWDKFEANILVNNKKLKYILKNNFNLIQNYKVGYESNLEIVMQLIIHIDEFEATRVDEEKIREVLYPVKINSLFGIAPIEGSFIPSIEAVEELISKLQEQGKFENIEMGVDSPYVLLKDNEEPQRIYLKDSPRLRQFYHDNRCFRSPIVRVEGLNFALKHIKSNAKLEFSFFDYKNLREIEVKGRKFIFIEEYCLSEVELRQLSPGKGSIVVNLHSWNGDLSITQEACELSKLMNVTLLTNKKFFAYVYKI